jgi:hypothetical protein
MLERICARIRSVDNLICRCQLTPCILCIASCHELYCGPAEAIIQPTRSSSDCSSLCIHSRTRIPHTHLLCLSVICPQPASPAHVSMWSDLSVYTLVKRLSNIMIWFLCVAILHDLIPAISSLRCGSREKLHAPHPFWI